jgi:cytochrome c oxidase cbb3-type subunit 2
MFFHWLEKNPFFFAAAISIVISFAGLIEIVPNFAQASRPIVDLKPRTVLELAGKNVYMKDNCMSCHSQMIRPFKSETDRYGDYSLSGEYAYDRPFLWGSKRTGPDLHRIGNYRTTDWHENHMLAPADIVPGSIMPAYKHQFTNLADIETAYAEAVTVKNAFHTPYGPEFKRTRAAWDAHRPKVLADAKAIADDMKNKDVKEAVANGQVPQGYASFFMTIFLVVMLYAYIIHLYRSEKKGERDYEKYGNIALDDEVTSTPVEDKPASKREYKEENK